jgi:hypothetical protein
VGYWRRTYACCGRSRGNLYADKSLKAYYQHSTKQSNDLKLQYQQFQMGALNGSANWTAELVLDPCKPKEVIQLKGRIIFNGVGMDMRFVQILILRKHPVHFSPC